MKTETLEKIIQKQDELIKHYESIMPETECPESRAEQIYLFKRNKLKSELTTLKEGLQGEEIKKTCHADEDKVSHNACAMQSSCDVCKSYR